MKFALAILVVVIGSSGCTVVPPPRVPTDTVANTTANYDFQGDLTADGGTDCWYYCF